MSTDIDMAADQPGDASLDVPDLACPSALRYWLYCCAVALMAAGIPVMGPV